MGFVLPRYRAPDFDQPPLREAPLARFSEVEQAGVAPADYHATSIYPEYFQVRAGHWVLVKESRMDAVVVLEPDGTLTVTEARRLQKGDQVACGRGEAGEDGIYVHTAAFGAPQGNRDAFSFRTRFTRETAFSIDYDELYELLDYERAHGCILWVLGPAAVFDHDARQALVSLTGRGYVHGLLSGNALAVHDIEGSLFGTALGQELYSKRPVPLGHYRHLDAINQVRALGGIAPAIAAGVLRDGVMHALVKNRIPYVLAGSIRDDGPLPEVVVDAEQAQDQMRRLTRRATTVIALATQLHSIATGNMLPSYHVSATGEVRPVYFYVIDMTEFAVDKLANRGSLLLRSILTNVQDFLVTLERGLSKRCHGAMADE
jgi:lysine-ketoglutarate reductase/saccharopine dehydrogenase-like protein (TIGR00300 family)